jgi:hypothetical protein
MTYAFISAQYANPDNTAAVALTQEVGYVAISAADTPHDWSDLHAWGTPSPYSAPALTPLPTKAELQAELVALQARIDLISG